ncbi:DUF2254 domain-containing protein [Pseudomonas sp. CFBP 8770]|uniref:DUF2254 domain-containing protein n=1 Tax=unclassified Pseudomonas TaxID=196821 RepID=UPI0017876128|nr:MULTISPECIES: DUF2254 domain-containing protein [unclassified Pseudomonas]MBD8472632.1 DUF2254 domain-containing protein [Pseudomonas sp. CFBP 8773]MBD8646266.1 DUF2254 domain-containing protein [Pseudomonas sp. CFBP 8770]
MIARWRWALGQMTKRLWFRASLFSLTGIATALVAIVFKDFVPADLPTRIGADSVDKILAIIASSMLAVTTFSLSTMVSAYSAASSGVTPRATSLVMEDTTTQNALATFIGSFLFSLVGIIALSTGAYGAQGRVVLFAVTIVMIILIVYTLLRWIDHLSKLGRVGETIDRVEAAALQSLKNRAQWPHMGAAPYPVDLIAPATARAVRSDETGYVQHIDIAALGTLGEKHGLQIYISILPGAFLHLGAPMAWFTEDSASHAPTPKEVDHDALAVDIRAAVTVGLRRSFEQDPRFGISVLAEIASRALSPATNDSGTVIDVIGRGVRCFTAWHVESTAEATSQAIDPHCRRVHVRGLQLADLFDDFFTLVARDGAGLLEVDIRMIKALISLHDISPETFGPQCRLHARRLIQRADAVLALDEDKQRLTTLAAPLLS